MQRIFITGGSGYLGGAILRIAGGSGMQVGASYYHNPPAAPGSTFWTQLDLQRAASIDAALAAFAPDVVIHTAFRQYDPDLFAVTATGAGLVASCCAARNIRLVHLSSDIIFDGEAQRPYTEEDTPNPITDYGRAKAAAEALVAAAHPGAAIVRTSLIYGIEPHDMHTRFVLDLASGRGDATLFTDEIRCPVFVDDLASALLELAALDYVGILNIAGPEALSRYQFGVLIARRWQHDPAMLKSGSSLDSGLRRPRNCVLASTRARQLLKTQLRSVSAILSKEPA
jgi:dTDP-4-dehydrorhamnose reductase